MSGRWLGCLVCAAALVAVATDAPPPATAAPPQCATNLTANVFAGTPAVLPPAPCSDPDGDVLTLIVVSGPDHGVLSAQAGDGTRTYTAAADYVGTDVVRFKANDGTADSAVSILTINVQGKSSGQPPNGPQQVVPSAPDPVDPGRCIGRGPRMHTQNGLMVAEEYRNPLRVFRPDGSGPERALTHPYHRQDSAPAWSPNGRQVAFLRAVASISEVWTVDVATGRERRIARNSLGPGWSPDGRWISFSGRAGLSAIHPDGTGERVIGTNHRSFDTASWSPNGRCLAGEAFDQDGLGSNLGLAIMNSSGGSPTVVFRYRAGFVGSRGAPPSWSRDGRRLLIVAQTSFSGHETRLVQVNVDGTGVRLLTRFRDIIHAVYSPDGRTIAFSRRKVKNGAFTNSGGVYTMPVRGGRSRLVIPRRYAAAWGPAR